MTIIDIKEDNNYIYKNKKYKYGELFFNLSNYYFNNEKTYIDFVKDFKIYEDEKDTNSILNKEDIQNMLNCFKNLVATPNEGYEKVRKINSSLLNIIPNNISIFKETIYKVKIDNVSLKEVIVFGTLKDFIVYDITHFLNSKRWASSCLNCHKLFFNNKQRHEQYCSKKCSNQYNYKYIKGFGNEFPILNELKKIKNRYYTRTTRYEDKYNRDYYEDWLIVANHLKEMYIGGEIKKEDDIEYLKEFLKLDPFEEEVHEYILKIINYNLLSTTFPHGIDFI